MFEWNDERIRFMRDAAEYGDYNGEFASLMARRMKPGDTVCDVGCGLGYLSLALARRGFFATGVDIAPKAIEVLRQNIRSGELDNCSALECDARLIPREAQFNAMAFCFFGSVETELELIEGHCLERAFIFKKTWQNHRFDPGRGRITHGYEDARAELEAKGIPFETELFSPEMGQPLRSLADAERFMEQYSSGGGAPDDWRERLVLTGRDDFPYFVPAHGVVAMITINARDARERERGKKRR